MVAQVLFLGALSLPTNVRGDPLKEALQKFLFSYERTVRATYVWERVLRRLCLAWVHVSGEERAGLSLGRSWLPNALAFPSLSRV